MKWLDIQFQLGVEDDRDIVRAANDVDQAIRDNLTRMPYYLNNLTVMEIPSQFVERDPA